MSEPKLSHQVIVVNTRGLHARAAAKFVDTAAQFNVEVHVSCNGERVNANSIMELLMLACHKGKTIQIEVMGQDAAAALEELVALVENGFGEMNEKT